MTDHSTCGGSLDGQRMPGGYVWVWMEEVDQEPDSRPDIHRIPLGWTQGFPSPLLGSHPRKRQQQQYVLKSTASGYQQELHDKVWEVKSVLRRALIQEAQDTCSIAKKREKKSGCEARITQGGKHVFISCSKSHSCSGRLSVWTGTLHFWM